MRKLEENGVPVEPFETDEASAHGVDYATALAEVEAKVPEDWQVLAWSVPDHLPG